MSAPRESSRLLADLQIAPSILAADFGRLAEQVGEVLEAGARVIHIDVMDGHFVPPITMGPIVVGALADQVHAVGGLLDVHLMIDRPERQITEFARAGADVISIHVESTPHVHFALGAIREQGCLAGLALNPATPASAIEGLDEALDMVLCMTVNPGWGGQRFIAATRSKIARARDRMPEAGAVQVDGGVDVSNAAGCVALGANVLVAGSAVFGAASPGDAFRRIAESAEAEHRRCLDDIPPVRSGA